MISAELRTSIAPPLRFGLEDLAGGGGRGGRPSLLLRLLRPSIVVRTPLGDLREAPAGDAGNTWQLALPAMIVGVVAIVGFAVYGVVSAVRSGR